MTALHKKLADLEFESSKVIVMARLIEYAVNQTDPDAVRHMATDLENLGRQINDRFGELYGLAARAESKSE